MCSGCRAVVGGVAAALIVIGATTIRAGARAVDSRVHDTPALRVCADPNNLPFSNQQQQGFENAIAARVARELGRPLTYFWLPQRRGFIRSTLKAGSCDLVIGVPADYELAATTKPYYRSTYVFVTRRDRRLRLHSFDDRRLTSLRVGIQMTGDDYENPPPAQALASRHLVNNVRGFMVYGDYSTAAPQRAVIDAVIDGRVDTAVVWGPLAGYFASRSAVALDVLPVTPAVDRFALPFTFDIAMGVRKGDAALRADLDRIIATRGHELRAILASFGVPLVNARTSARASRVEG